MGIAELDCARHSALADELWLRLKKRLIDPCEKCEGRGKIPKGVTFIDDCVPVTSSSMCDCKIEALLKLNLHDAGVPVEFWEVESIEAKHNAEHFKELRWYAERVERAIEHGLGYLLTGENGSGKSSSACIPLIAALRAGYTAAFINWPDLVSGWRRSWDDSNLARHLDGRTQRDFVVLDEVGKEHEGRDETFVASKLDSLIRMRRGSMLPTIITTNLEAETFLKRYGDSIGSLLADRFKVLAYKPGDFRVKLAHWNDLMGD